MKTLWLTGASGMVGRNILEHPAAVGWRILKPSSTELDLTDWNAVQTWVAREKPDVVVHAAGQVGGIQANVARPVDFLARNAAIGQNVIMAAWQNGVREFVNLASTCMYPRDIDAPFTEDLILSGRLDPPNEGYALAKIMSTRLCEYIRREDSSAHFKTLIPCNLYGRNDKFDPTNSHLIPAVIHKLHLAKQSGAKSVEIWGDGTARREFMYSGDLADAVMRAVQDVSGLPDLMNIGVGRDHSINEYYAAVAEVLGWYGDFVHDLAKPVGTRRRLADVSRQQAWGWAPPTSLQNGIARTYEFYLEAYN